MHGCVRPPTYTGWWLSDAVAVYSISQRMWQPPYPPMYVHCALPAVATYHQHLVVSGGIDATWTDLASVEILEVYTQHSRWLNITPLPMSCHLMSSAIIHDSLYLLGGSSKYSESPFQFLHELGCNHQMAPPTSPVPPFLLMWQLPYVVHSSAQHPWHAHGGCLGWL